MNGYKKLNQHYHEHELLKSFDVKEYVITLLSHWKLILLSLFITCTAAFFYLKYSNKKYKAVATILIKNEKNKSHNELEMFDDLGIAPVNANYIEDEIEIIRSRPLIAKIVKKNRLNTRYYLKKRFTNTELFNDTPIEVIFLQSANRAFNFYVKLLSKNKFSLFINDEFIGNYSFNQKIEQHGISFMIIKNEKTTYKKFINSSILITHSTIISEANRIISSVKIKTMRKNSNGLILETQAESKDRSILILDAIIDQYNIEAFKENNLIAQRTADFIDERLQLISKDLSIVEKQVETFKRSNNIADLGAETHLFLNEVSSNDDKFIELSTQIELTQLLQEFIRKNELSPIKIEVGEEMVMANIIEYNKLINELNYLNKSLSKSHPLVKALINKLTDQKRELKGHISNYQSYLKLKLKKIQSKENTIQSQLKKVPKKEREYRAVERQQKIKESLYIYLLQKKEATAISIAAKTSNAKIINKAYALAAPIFPRPKFTYLIAIMLGLVIPTIYIFIKKELDSKIYTSNDIEQLLDIPLLGEISKSEETKRYLVNDKDFSGTAESFRLFDANLDFLLSNLEEPKRTILITSSISGEGKSFIALNYARTLAFSKKKVLVVGLDLRAPKLLEYTGLKSKYGVAEYVKDSKLELRDITVSSNELKNLHIIGAGKTPRNPTDYMRSPRIQKLFTTANKEYDYVIVDTSPIGKVTDTLLLNKYVDICVYVVRADYLDKKLLDIPQKLYDEKRYKHLALLLNAVDYSKSYYYYKNYGYGYLSNDKRSWLKKVI